MRGYREDDASLEENYSKSTGTERLAFFNPSEQHIYFYSNPNTFQPEQEELPTLIQGKFTELTADDIGLYNKPPRG